MWVIWTNLGIAHLCCDSVCLAEAAASGQGWEGMSFLCDFVCCSLRGLRRARVAVGAVLMPNDILHLWGNAEDVSIECKGFLILVAAALASLDNTCCTKPNISRSRKMAFNAMLMLPDDQDLCHVQAFLEAGFHVQRFRVKWVRLLRRTAFTFTPRVLATANPATSKESRPGRPPSPGVPRFRRPASKRFQ